MKGILRKSKACHSVGNTKPRTRLFLKMLNTVLICVAQVFRESTVTLRTSHSLFFFILYFQSSIQDKPVPKFNPLSKKNQLKKMGHSVRYSEWLLQ